MKAAILDYGLGNIHSIRGALKGLGLDVQIDQDGVPPADLLVLPGVGAWAPAVKALEGLRDRIRDAVEDGTPLLGVCLGHQLLYETSDEGAGEGLGILKGHVRTLDHPRLPHIGWNTLDEVLDERFQDLEGEHVYYVHSYAAPVTEDTAAITDHGERFTAIAAQGAVLGTQFHPEKSGAVGQRLLAAWLASIR